MIRLAVLSATLLIFPGSLPGGPADTFPLPRVPASPPTLAEIADSARAAWQRRDLRALLSPAGSGRVLVTVPAGGQSAPITVEQAGAVLSSYLQGTQEVRATVVRAIEVDSLQAYVELGRRYRAVGIPGEREGTILLGYRRGGAGWVLTEVRVAS